MNAVLPEHILERFSAMRQERLKYEAERGQRGIFVGSGNVYNAFQSSDKKRQFHWTVRADTNGDYWCGTFVYRKKDYSWDLTGSWVRCAKRKTARAKALARYERYEAQIATRTASV